MKPYEMEVKPVIRRFFVDYENAEEMAHLLFSTLKTKQPVFVFKTMFGIFETKQAQYSVRLLSEGVRPDSIAIVYSIGWDKILKDYDITLKKAS